jgi:hypothetical protein
MTQVIPHNTVLDLLRITILVYNYGSDITLSDDTIETFVNKMSESAEHNMNLDETKKQILFDIAKKIPNGKVCNFINDKETDLQCGITINDDNKRICVVFRGSESLSDWYYDLYVIKKNLKDDVWVHNGFYKQLHDTDAYTKIVQNIKIQLETHPDYEIYITGHSLGAALATLFGYLLAHDIKNNVTVVSFASPRVGNSSWQKSFESKSNLTHYRVTNCRDIITAFPSYNYKHVGKNIRLFENTHSIYMDYKDESIYDYTILRCWSANDHNSELYYKHLLINEW